MNFILHDLPEESPHECVDDEVAGAVDDEGPVHEARQTDNPAGRFEVRALVDAWTHEELSEVDDESWEVAKEKYDDDADEDAGEVHLVVGVSIPTLPGVGVPRATGISMARGAGQIQRFHQKLNFDLL